MIENIKKRSISIILPMYNSEKTIIRALDSIRNQTAFDYIREAIIVNDGSQDNSSKIVEEYTKKHTNIPIEMINKTNGGVSSARNIGMDRANGDWFALLDSDDEWINNKLEIQIDAINNNKNIDFLGGAINSKPLRIFNKTISELYKVTLKDLCIKMFPQTSTVIFKRKVYDTVGGYDESQSHAEDGNYFMKICSNFNYYYLPSQMVIYDGGKPGFGSGGLSGNLRKMHEGSIKNIRELRNDESITLICYYFLRAFYEFKYFRRILFTKLRFL